MQESNLTSRDDVEQSLSCRRLILIFAITAILIRLMLKGTWNAIYGTIIYLPNVETLTLLD